MIKKLNPTIKNAKILFDLIQEHREEIQDFLPRINSIKTIEDERQFLLDTYRKWEYWYWIMDEDNLTIIWYVWIYNICVFSWRKHWELWIRTTKKWTWYNAMVDIMKIYEDDIDEFITIVDVLNAKSIAMVERLWFKKYDIIEKYRKSNWRYEDVFLFVK